MAFDQSPHGYWVSNEGAVHPLLEPQSHAVLGQTLILDTALDANALHDWMLRQGWVAVSFDPTGQQMSVRCQEIGLDRRTVSGLVRIISDHEWRQRSIYTEFRVEPFLGNDLYKHLRSRSRENQMFPDPKDEIASLKIRLQQANDRADAAEAINRETLSQSGIDDKAFYAACKSIVVTTQLIESDVKKFFDITKKEIDPKKILDLAHYYFGHELERRRWYIGRLVGDIRKSISSKATP